MDKLLRVDLSRDVISEERLDKDVLLKFVGGRGLGAKVIFDEVDPLSDPLGKDSRLVFATGPLTGTKAPTSGRFTASFKSPLTGLLTDCNCGGFFGPWIKWAGYDLIVIQGRADLPSYVVVSDQGCEINEARDLWGKKTGEVDRLLEKRHRGKVACIGPAGENGALIANVIVNGRRALGRGGIGAVMGSKMLKALVVSGSREVQVPAELEGAIQEATSLIKKKISTGWGLRSKGTVSVLPLLSKKGILPVRNYQRSRSDKVDLTLHAMEEMISGRQGCYMCPIACGHKITLPDGKRIKSPEFETLWSLGVNLDSSDAESTARAGALCDEYGLDTISTGMTLSAAVELEEKGKIKEGLRWDDPQRVLDLVPKIARREGIGKYLAEGSRRLCQMHDDPEASMSVKGLELPAYDPRGAQGMGLAYATSNRGGCHMKAYIVLSELRSSSGGFTTEDKAELVMKAQDLSAFEDSLVLCRFVQPVLGAEILARLYSAATGTVLGIEGLMETGGRIYNHERLFNIRAGCSEDTLPKRLTKEEIGSGPAQGQTVRLEEMIVEYYRLRGWTSSGLIPDRTLRRYGVR